MPYILHTITNQSKQELWFEGLWFSGDGEDIRWCEKTKKKKKKRERKEKKTESEQKEWIMEARGSQ